MVDVETITIVGMGYVGRALATALEGEGFNVYGYDYVKEACLNLPAGEPEDCIPYSDFVIICVPTPLRDHSPDLSCLKDALRMVSEHFKPGATIVIESTSYPGTTEELAKPILDESGKDYYLGYSPERIDPGNTRYGLKNTPKVVSGIDKQSLKRVGWLYSQIVDEVVEVSSTRVAEASKLLENTYRAVNIGLMFELAKGFDLLGVNTFEVVEAAKPKPFGFMPFYPSAGVGGDCIPTDPLYLQHKFEEYGMQSEYIDLFERMNKEVQERIAFLGYANTDIRDKVLVLGVAFKRGVSDTRNSPARHIIKKLSEAGRIVHFCDPYVREFDGVERVSTKDLRKKLRSYECILFLTGHHEFRDFDFSKYEGKIIDAVDFFNPNNLNAKYIGVGKGYDRLIL